MKLSLITREGLDIEVLTMNALKQSFLDSTTKFEQEHVTQHIHLNSDKFKTFNIKNDNNLSHNRWTIDTIEDYNFAKAIYDDLYVEDEIFLPEEIYQLLEKNKNNINLFDTVIFIIMVYSIVQCFLKGFSLSFISFLKWILSIILNFIIIVFSHQFLVIR